MKWSDPEPPAVSLETLPIKLGSIARAVRHSARYPVQGWAPNERAQAWVNSRRRFGPFRGLTEPEAALLARLVEFAFVEGQEEA